MASAACEGMVFAAGLGTRLAPLTDRLPKALVEVGGRTLLEIVARRLVAAGAGRLVVNTCAHAQRVEDWLAAHPLGVPVHVSREEGAPLETGGGLYAARALFSGTRPLLVHNVDVLSDVPLGSLLAAHGESGALVTLAVMQRPSRRRLLFDRRGLLGRVDDAKGLDLRVRPAEGEVEQLAFAGIHVASPALLGRITERGRFSVLDTWLRLAGEGERLLPWRMDAWRWIDVGRPADLERARALAGPAAAPGADGGVA